MSFHDLNHLSLKESLYLCYKYISGMNYHSITYSYVIQRCVFGGGIYFSPSLPDIIPQGRPVSHHSKHTSAQRLRRWSNIVQMSYKCFAFAVIPPGHRLLRLISRNRAFNRPTRRGRSPANNDTGDDTKVPGANKSSPWI